jgi:hypothetical protein
MLLTEEIDVMPVADMKRDFYNLMNTIVLEYGDNQEETREQNEVTASPSSTLSGGQSLSTTRRVAPHALKVIVPRTPTASIFSQPIS